MTLEFGLDSGLHKNLIEWTLQPAQRRCLKLWKGLKLEATVAKKITGPAVIGLERCGGLCATTSIRRDKKSTRHFPNIQQRVIIYRIADNTDNSNN